MAISNNDRETLLLTIKKKLRALADADGALAAALSKPASNRAVIQTQLDADALESKLLDARFKAIEAGGNFTFPTQTEMDNLTNAIAELETAIAQSAAVTALIVAAAAVASTVKASGI